jgi:hypothetical protein
MFRVFSFRQLGCMGLVPQGGLFFDTSYMLSMSESILQGYAAMRGISTDGTERSVLMMYLFFFCVLLLLGELM